MNAVATTVRVLHWLGLVLWAGALMSAGIAAMNVFSTLDASPLRLDAYAGYPAAEHPRLAAGQIMEGVFFTADLLQFIAVPLVVVTLLVQVLGRQVRRRSISTPARLVFVGIAAGLFAYHATALAPAMNRELRAYWTAAEAGDVETAHAHRAAFQTYHPTADAILRVDLLLIVLVIIITAAAAPPDRPRHGSTAPTLLMRR